MTDLSQQSNLEVFVGRRSYIAGAAVVVVSLIIGGAAMAAASTKHHHKHHVKPKPKPTVELYRCSSAPITVPPPGQASSPQPASSGQQYGTVSCSTTGFGNGVMSDAFTVPDSGDLTGTFTQYFSTGTVSGTFDVSPTESQPIGSDTFTAQSYSGTAAVTSGTGAFAGTKGKDNKGTMACDTQDSVHYTCTQNIMIVIPPPATTTATGARKS
jgi:hypothetical protein